MINSQNLNTWSLIMLNLHTSCFNQFLSLEECSQIEQTLLPTRDDFLIRITVYSWRYLQQASTGLGVATHPLMRNDQLEIRT
jgi:hypothetical protein